MIAGQNAPVKNAQCQRVLHQPLNRAPERARAVSKVVAFGEQQIARGRGLAGLSSKIIDERMTILMLVSAPG